MHERQTAGVRAASRSSSQDRRGTAGGHRSFYLAEKFSGLRPTVIHAHTTAEDFANSFVMSDVLAPHLGRVLTHFHNKADLVIAPTLYTKEVLERHGVARSLGRGRHLPSGVVVFAVGLVLLRKGIDLFCEVAHRLPRLTFIWFGPIHRAVKPETLRVLDEAPPNARFPGYVENITEAYAAAAGRPLVLRDAECFAGRFVDSENCLKASDPDGFSRHVTRLADEPDLRARLGEEARRFAEAHSIEQVGQVLRAVYARLRGLEASPS